MKMDDIVLSLRKLVVSNRIPVFVLYKNEVSGLFTIYPKHSGIFSSPPSKNFMRLISCKAFSENCKRPMGPGILAYHY